MITGKVKFFNESKGFGFIIPDDGNLSDVFFHCTKVQGRITKDDSVQFELENTKKGLQAVNVKKVK